ncbi:MAG: exosortase-associated EpsI family protein [Verrucomicrobiota bacterium]
MKTKQKFKTLLPMVLAAGLILAVGLQWFGGRADPNYVPPPPLASLLPKTVAGWEVSDQPLASSEEERTMVSELLNYNDAVFRIYRRGPDQFTVYAAHWDPGRMSPRLVASHTPDVCWAGNGWERLREVEKQPLANGESEAAQLVRLEAKAGLQPAQFRVFQNKVGMQHLVFWHIHGRDVLSYDTEYAPPWWAMFTDLAKNGLAQRKEQWFIRIGSNVPYPGLWDDPGFQQVLAQLAKMGLQKPPAPPAS